MAVSQPWDVSLNGEVVDTVWFDPTMTADEVRKSLIEHDGYNNHISVVKA